MKHKTTLKQAQSDPKAMKKFVQEHKDDQIESTDFDKVFSSMTPAQGKSKVVLAKTAATLKRLTALITSKLPRRGDCAYYVPDRRLEKLAPFSP